ncbi:uncharacterized protein LOC144676522 [Cetorhinus maximus]
MAQLQTPSQGQAPRLRASSRTPAPPPPQPPAPGKRRRGRPRIRTELELEQRRKAWYRQRYLCSVYLGQQSERWKRVRQQLGHHKDEQTAQSLLDSFSARSRGSCSGKVCSAENIDHLHTSCDALRQLMVWSHDHSRECGFIPNLKSIVSGRVDDSVTVVWSCAGGHSYSWEMLALRKGVEEGGGEQRAARAPARSTGRPKRRVLSTLPANGKRARLGSERVTKEGSQEVLSDEQVKETDSSVTTEGDAGGASCQMRKDGEPASSVHAVLPEAQEETETPTPPVQPVQAEGEGKAGDNHSFEQPTPVESLPATPSQEDVTPQGATTPGRPRRNCRKVGRTPAQLDNADLLQLVCESDSEDQPNEKANTRQEEQQQEGSQESEMQVAETELMLTSFFFITLSESDWLKTGCWGPQEEAKLNHRLALLAEDGCKYFSFASCTDVL